MEKLNNNKTHHQKKHNMKASKMEVELGNEWTGDAERVANKVETRVKTTASRYGFIHDNE